MTVGGIYMRAKDYRVRAWKMLSNTNFYWESFALIIGVALLSAIPFVGLIVVGALSAGLINFVLAMYKDNKINANEVIKPLKTNVANTFVGYFLMKIFTLFWALLLIIPGIVKHYSYSLTLYLLANNEELSGKEALEESKRLMHGHKKRLFFLDLSFIGWIILSLFTFGIGLLFLAPYIQASRVVFFDDLMAIHRGNESKDNVLEEA